jgi:hypothetical protein
MSQCTPRHPDCALTAREAAEIIYKTRQPTPAQVHHVREHFARSGSPSKSPTRGRQTTTANDVAEYIAGQTYLRQLHDGGKPQAKHSRAGEGRQSLPLPARKDYAPLRAVYQDILKDYFLALILRRRRRDVTKTFRRAVVAGQVGVVLTTIALLAVSLQSLSGSLPWNRPLEQAAVEQWLAENETEFSVTRWYPAVQSAGEEGASVRVEYSYTTAQGKTVATDRIFVIRDGRVASQSSAP